MTTDFLTSLAERLYQAVSTPDSETSTSFTCPVCQSNTFRISISRLTWLDAGSLQILFPSCGTRFIFGFNNVREFSATCSFMKLCNTEPLINVEPEGYAELRNQRGPRDSITMHFFFREKVLTRKIPCTDLEDRRITSKAQLKLPKTNMPDHMPLSSQEIQAIWEALPESRRASFVISLDEVLMNRFLLWQHDRAKRQRVAVVDKVDRP